jgi:C1A family cysteine protease
MIRRITKHSVLAPPPSIAVTRRDFVSGTAALTAGAAAGGLLPTASWGAGPPTSYDLRTDNYVTAVQNQGLSCNSCTAYAVVAAVECTYNKKNSLSGTSGPNLDEMDLFNNHGPPFGCSTTHWWPRHALAVCMTNGLKWEGPSSSQPVYAAATYLLVDNDVNETQKKMKDWIFNHGPVVAVMIQYADFYKFGTDWSGPGANPKVYEPGKHNDPGPAIGGHSIAIVGYDGNDHWICKNSWGSGWNGDGYVKIAQGKGKYGETYVDCIDVWGVSVLP